jgi:hypothetical protein
MAVAFSAKVSGGNGPQDGTVIEASGATSVSGTNLTAGASDSLILGSLGLGSATTTTHAMTWNSVGMTAVTTAQQAGGTTMWMGYLASPASGAKTLAASWVNAADVYMSGITFTGSDTTTPLVSGDTKSGTALGSPGTVTMTSTTDGATAVSLIGNAGSPTITTQTEWWLEQNLSPGGGGSYAIGGTSNAHTFTGHAAGNYIGVHIQAASGGAAPVGSYTPVRIPNYMVGPPVLRLLHRRTNPAMFRQAATPAASAVVFRKTLSSIGTRTGARQTQGI